jgi:cellulose synthase/poly-beta-1,6-N-acetylglucosamine synthase-like glycosyltransferase
MQFLYFLFVFALLVQCCYGLWYLAMLPGLNRKIQIKEAPRPVSVIICARNEAANLERNLGSILKQEYKDPAGKLLYEVIVVNDASDDDTALVLDAFAGEFTQLKIVTLTADMPRNLPGKKFALGQGLARAQYDYLLLTDADCYANSAQWLRMMTGPLHQGKEIVAGYGGYVAESGWLNTFIRWETVHTFIQYSTYASSGLPYMAVGRNLACTRQVLEQAQQTDAWRVMPSGDDDLLVRSGASAHNMAVVAHPAAITRSFAKNTFKDWILQKQRHVSTGKLYKPLPKMLLGLYALTHATGWLLGCFLLLAGWYLPVLCLWAIRATLMLTANRICRMQLNETSFKMKALACDFGWALYNFVLSPYIFLKNKQKWT